MHKGQIVYYLIFIVLAMNGNAIEENCSLFYSFQNDSDLLENIQYANNGWFFDENNQSYKSGDMPQSSFSIEMNGPIIISFDYKTSSIEEGIGVFQFLVDGIPQPIRKRDDWTLFSISIVENRSHEIKWIVHKGKRPFAAWIDSLCIKGVPTPINYESRMISSKNYISSNQMRNKDDSKVDELTESKSNTSESQNFIMSELNRSNQSEIQSCESGTTRNTTNLNFTSSQQLNRSDSFSLTSNPSIDVENFKIEVENSAKLAIKKLADEFANETIGDDVRIEAKKASEEAVMEDVKIIVSDTVKTAIADEADDLTKEVVDSIFVWPFGETIKTVFKNKIKGEVKKSILESSYDSAILSSEDAIRELYERAAIDEAESMSINVSQEITENISGTMAKEIALAAASAPIMASVDESIDKAITEKTKEEIKLSVRNRILTGARKAAQAAAKEAVLSSAKEFALRAAKTTIREISENAAKNVAKKAIKSFAKKILEKAVKKGFVKASRYWIPGVDVIFAFWDLYDLYQLSDCFSDPDCLGELIG